MSFEIVRQRIDGRADMYGDTFVLDWWDMVNGDMPKFEAAARKYQIRWTLLNPSEPLVKQLDASPRWRRIYADKIGVIHVRADAGPGSPDWAVTPEDD